MKTLQATAFLAFVLVPMSAPAQEREKPKAVVVPFEMLPSNHMLVQASVNGKEPGRFIFDVGAPVTLLGGKAAEETGVIDGKAPKLMLFGARGDGKAKTFKMGDAEVKDMPVMIMDHPAVAALASLLDKPIDGLVGYTFFARFRTTIDYQKKEMTLEPVEFEAKDLAQSLTGQLQLQLGGARQPAAKRVLAPSGFWGLVLQPADDPDAPGVKVAEVRKGSPAESAGLKAGDLLTTLDGRWTVGIADTYAAAAKVEAGREVEVVVRRDGQEKTLRVAPRAGL